MGAWDVGGFENDEAGDWVCELEDAKDLSILEDTLSQITNNKEYLEAPECSEAIAAAEVVAALNKRSAADLPEEVECFVEKIDAQPPPTLLASALRVIERIKTASELKELWEESESAEEWHQALADLESRLR